jgi:hypothetical protein
MNFLNNLFGPESDEVKSLKAEKKEKVDALVAEYDAKIEAAKKSTTPAPSALPPGPGMATSVGGRHRRKTKRSKKTRSGRKSSRL